MAGSSWRGAPKANLSTKVQPFFARHPRQNYSSPQGVSHLRAAGEDFFRSSGPLCGGAAWCSDAIVSSEISTGPCLQTSETSELSPLAVGHAVCTGVAVEQARRRRTASGKRSGGAGRSRFPGEKRTFTCSLHEKKRPHDQGRHHGRIVKFSIASVISARYAGCAPSVRHATGTLMCPVRKKVRSSSVMSSI